MIDNIIIKFLLVLTSSFDDPCERGYVVLSKRKPSRERKTLRQYSNLENEHFVDQRRRRVVL